MLALQGKYRHRKLACFATLCKAQIQIRNPIYQQAYHCYQKKSKRQNKEKKILLETLETELLS